MKRFRYGFAIAIALLSAGAGASDWFVRAGSDGDGSKDKPFKDMAWALEKAEAGDSIHVAAGEYTGKLDVSNWIIAVPNLTVLGGYNENFTARDPWKTPTLLHFVKDAKVKTDGWLFRGERDHSGCVIDGFVLDGRDKNGYADGPYGDIDLGKVSREPVASFSSPNVTIRNCVMLNGGSGGVQLAGEGCTFENNLVMNMNGTLLELRGANQTKTSIVKGNTFMFSWAPVYGKGGPDGIGVKLVSGTKADLTGNLFQNCDNHGIFVDTKPDRVSLKKNAFWLNGYSNVKIFVEGRDIAFDKANMGDLDDAGFKAVEANECVDPKFALDTKWIERFINRTASERGKVTMDDWNTFRQLVGAPLQAEGGKGPTGFCMAYDWKKAMTLIPKAGSAGMKPVALTVKLGAGGSAAAPAAAGNFERITYEKLLKEPQSLDGKSVELAGVFGGERSWYPIAGVDEKQYRGIELYDIKPMEGRAPLIYVKRGTNAEKTFDAGTPYNGQGEPRPKLILKGVVKFDANAQAYFKGTLLVQTAEPFVEAVAEVKRPVGRDWFVRAGSSGDGSKEKPFKDPWQALEKAETGDVVHVAEGEYFGKLKTGYWTIDTRYLSMLGGYDANFTERDPWKHPTRLGFQTGAKSWTEGSYIRGDFDHEGFIFDGFVLDGKDVNVYGTDGTLKFDRSTRHALIEVNSPNCEVRNCLLINGSLGAVTLIGSGGVLENNIMLNFHWQTLQLTPGITDKPYVIRGNTILFTWYDRADGQAQQAVGSGIYARGDMPLEIDNNVIAFQDTCGVFTSAASKGVKLTNNVFARNLTAHYCNGGNVVLDDATFAKGSDAGFAAFSGNQCVDPQLKLNPAWMERYLGRTMTIHGKVTMDDWNKTRELLGLPVKSDLGKFATDYAPAYDWKEALGIVAQNPAVKAGARPVKLAVHFNPTPKAEAPAKTYQNVEFPVIQNQVATIDKKDIEFVGLIGEQNSGWFVPEIKTEDGWIAIQLSGPAGVDSGLPVQAYFKKGTLLEKQLRKSEKGAKYILRGVARTGTNFSRGCMVLEAIEKSE